MSSNPIWNSNFFCQVDAISTFNISYVTHSNYLMIDLLFSTGDREFIFLDEQLTKLILDLDKVQTDGLEDVRVARKSAVQRIQFLIDTLESKG